MENDQELQGYKSGIQYAMEQASSHANLQMMFSFFLREKGLQSEFDEWVAEKRAGL